MTGHLSVLLDKLWLQRHLLELLVFKLTEARLLLVADERRFVPRALAEVDAVTDRSLVAELERSLAVDAVAEEWGIRPDALSLGYLAAHAPEPQASMLDEHRGALLELTSEIRKLRAENRRLAAGVLVDITASLDGLQGDEPELHLQQVGYRATIASMSRALPPALEDFLR